MNNPDDIIFYYHGDEGEYLHGVPARDLTALDVESLDPLMKRDVIHATVPRGDKVIPLYSKHEGDPTPTSNEPPKWYTAYLEGAVLTGVPSHDVLPGETKAAFEARIATLNPDPSPDAAPAEGEKG